MFYLVRSSWNSTKSVVDCYWLSYDVIRKWFHKQWPSANFETLTSTYINYSSDLAVSTSVPDARVSSCPGSSQRPPCHATRGDRAAKNIVFLPFLHFGFTVSGVPSVVAPYQINELNDNIDNIDIGSVTLSDIKWHCSIFAGIIWSRPNHGNVVVAMLCIFQL
jgi:hypothetical protein